MIIASDGPPSSRSWHARAHRREWHLAPRGARGRRLHVRRRLHRRAGVHRPEERARIPRLARGEEPVEGLEETLQAEVTFGERDARPRDQPAVRRAGRVRVGLLPDRRRAVHVPDLRRGRGRPRSTSPSRPSPDSFGEVAGRSPAGSSRSSSRPTADVVRDAEAGAAAATHRHDRARRSAAPACLPALVALGLTLARRRHLMRPLRRVAPGRRHRRPRAARRSRRCPGAAGGRRARPRAARGQLTGLGRPSCPSRPTRSGSSSASRSRPRSPRSTSPRSTATCSWTARATVDADDPYALVVDRAPTRRRGSTRHVAHACRRPTASRRGVLLLRRRRRAREVCRSVPAARSMPTRTRSSVIGRWLTYLGPAGSLGLAAFQWLVLREGPMPRRLAQAARRWPLRLGRGRDVVTGAGSASRRARARLPPREPERLLQLARAAVAALGAVVLLLRPRGVARGRSPSRPASPASSCSIVAGHASAVAGQARDHRPASSTSPRSGSGSAASSGSS